MEREKEEAFRIYVSDSLALYTTMITRGEIEIPRYADIYKAVPQQPQESPEEIISRFDKLRRK